MYNIKIKNKNGNIINIDFRYPENTGSKLPLLVFCHGFKGFKDWGCFPYMFDKFANANIFTVSFNFSLNGVDNEKNNPVDFERLDDFARNTFSEELDDLGCVIDYLEEVKDKYNYNFDSLILAGHSRGGGIAILKTAEDKRIKKLITLASVDELNRYGDETKRMWKERGFVEALNTRTRQKMRMNVSLLEDLENNYSRLNIKDAMKKANVPTLIMHGTEDLAVEKSEAETLYNLCNKDITKLVILEKTGHTFGAVHPFAGTTPHLEEVIEEIITFSK
ncbi:MAG: prolyl oligopeptidase family serine peptidase [Ignavibacteriae bacterium]|nr:prolyl oligopeptidase family serine peptidase [Ignavibacteriota bacterium]